MGCVVLLPAPFWRCRVGPVHRAQWKYSVLLLVFSTQGMEAASREDCLLPPELPWLVGEQTSFSIISPLEEEMDLSHHYFKSYGHLLPAACCSDGDEVWESCHSSQSLCWAALSPPPASAEAPGVGRYQWQEQDQVKNVMECEAGIENCHVGMARFRLSLELVDTWKSSLMFCQMLSINLDNNSCYTSLFIIVVC